MENEKIKEVIREEKLEKKKARKEVNVELFIVQLFRVERIILINTNSS